MSKTKNTRKQSAYPTRGVTLSDEVWEQLRNEKIKFGKNWNAFIKELLNKQK